MSVTGEVKKGCEWCSYTGFQADGETPCTCRADNALTACQQEVERLTRERDEALEAESEAKDCFWAIYPDWVDMKGHGITTEAARTLLADRAETASPDLGEEVVAWMINGIPSPYPLWQANGVETRIPLITLGSAHSALARKDAESKEYREMFVRKSNEKVEALRRAETAEARNAELVKALEPFARHLNEMKFDIDHEGNELPDEHTCGWIYLTLADFRRARAALGGQSNEA